MASSAASFKAADYVVFSVVLVISLSIGVFQGLRGGGQGTKIYLLGEAGIPLLTFILSLFAGIVSASAILGDSSEMYYYGSQRWMIEFGTLFGAMCMCAVILPILYPLRLVSMYEYFHVRFGDAKLQKLTTVLQLFHFLANLGLIFYGPSLALASVTPVPVNASVLVLGIVCVIYSSVGGARGVVYADTFQAVVMFSGVIAVIIQGCAEVGGPSNAWQIDKEHGRIDFFNLSTDPFERHTLLWVLIQGTYSGISMYGAAQPQYQRWIAVNSLKKSILMVAVSAVMTMAFKTLWSYAGLVVFSVYVDCDPLSAGYITKQDQVIAYFVVDKLSSMPGIPGLFVSSIYSAVLSSGSSKLNGIAAMIWKDLLQPLPFFVDTTETTARKILITISVLTGVVAIMSGLAAGGVSGLTQATYTIGGALSGPVVGLYFTAILCPWVTSWGAFLGALTGLTLNLWITVGHYLYGTPTPMLPLSTDGCPNPTIVTDILTTTSSTFTTTCPTTPPETPDEVFPLYQLTYCLYGTIGAGTTFCMSTIFSCLFGPAKLSSVPENTVNQTALRFYRWLRLKCGAKRAKDTNEAGRPECISGGAQGYHSTVVLSIIT